MLDLSVFVCDLDEFWGSGMVWNGGWMLLLFVLLALILVEFH